MTLMTVQIG